MRRLGMKEEQLIPQMEGVSRADLVLEQSDQIPLLILQDLLFFFTKQLELKRFRVSEQAL